MTDLERISKEQLQKIYPRSVHNGMNYTQYSSPCEACGKEMQDHEWVDMDPNGYVEHCSNIPVAEEFPFEKVLDDDDLI